MAFARRVKYLALPAQTIETRRGTLAIEQLRVGDSVIGTDGRFNKVKEIDKQAQHGSYYIINGFLSMYRNQSVIADGQVTHAFRLRAGQKLTLLDGTTIKVTDIVRRFGHSYFYKLQVSGDHTYHLNGVLVHNASRFWVGGTGNWDASTTTNWAASTGGAGGQSVPTSSDDVTFDTLSNATAYTCTVTATANTANFTTANPLSGALTFAGSSTMNVFGNYNMANITLTHSGTVSFKATSTGKTITTNGETITHNWTFDGVGGGWTLQDNVTATSRTWTLTNGAIDFNGKTCTLLSFTSNATNTRSITLGAANVTCSGSGARFNTGTSTGLTFSGASSTITVTETSSGSNGFQSADGITWGTITVNTGTSTSTDIDCLGDFTCTTLSILFGTGGAGVNVNSFVVSGTLTITGNATQRGLIRAEIDGTAETLTAAVTTLLRVDFSDITGAGGGTWAGTTIGDCLGNTNITFNTPVTRYWVDFNGGNWNTTASWSASDGGASGASVPLPQDTAIINNNSITFASSTITMGIIRVGAINFTGVLNTPTLDISIGHRHYGDITYVVGMSVTGAGTHQIHARSGSRAVTCAGLSLGSMNFILPGASLNLTGNLVCGAFTISYGTFSFGANNVTCSTFSSSNSNVRSISMGSGTWTVGAGINFSGGQPWALTTTTNLTFDAQTSTIKIVNGGNSQATFAGGGLTYYNFWYNPSVAQNLTVQGSNTFNDFKADVTLAYSILFTTGINTTVNSFTVSGIAGQLITINSTTTGTHTLTKAGGGVVSCDYLSVQHSLAKPGAWYAGLNSTNNQGVSTVGSGWIFNVPPIPNKGYGINQAPNRAATY